MAEYSLEPKLYPRVDTALRRIVTPLPAPEAVPLLQSLAQNEPRSMAGQPPIVWDRAEGFQVFDAWGNHWIDWSSGVLIANAGHGRREIIDAITKQAQSGLLTSYAFPHAARARLAAKLAALTPEPLKKVFLLTTGSEAVEFAIKVSRTWGLKTGGAAKNVFVTFDKAFHGRTLGAQLAGGIPALKDWIGALDPSFVQVPFPDGFWTEDTSFAYFEQRLASQGVNAETVCGVMLETYQGGTAAFAPPAYMQALRAWCDKHSALLICDEVQAGFGRNGKLFGFEHYGIVPDLTTWGKGISSSLPLAAVAGRPDLMDLHPPGSASSTHSGNPVCCAAGLANVELILKEGLVEKAAVNGALLHQKLNAIRRRWPQRIGAVCGKGMVAGVICTQPGRKEPDGALAAEVVWKCITKGVLMFSPVGFQGSTIKICPPLVITPEAIEESCGVLEEAFAEVLG